MSMHPYTQMDRIFVNLYEQLSQLNGAKKVLKFHEIHEIVIITTQ